MSCLKLAQMSLWSDETSYPKNDMVWVRDFDVPLKSENITKFGCRNTLKILWQYWTFSMSFNWTLAKCTLTVYQTTFPDKNQFWISSVRRCQVNKHLTITANKRYEDTLYKNKEIDDIKRYFTYDELYHCHIW